VAATLAYNWGMVSEPRVDVHMPGGMATVIVGENTRLIGPATYIADIEVARGQR
jgi:diaminopimelate epimerase